MTPTKPEDVLVERLRQGVIVMGFGSGDQEMVDIVTANQAMRKAADAITTLLERESRKDAALNAARVVLRAHWFGNHTAVVVQISAALTGDGGVL